MLPSPRAARNWPSYWPTTWLCLLVIAAVGLQLRQAQLWPQWAYQGLCAVGAVCLLAGVAHTRRSMAALLLGTAMLAFGSTGWRASHYAARILPAHLQQRDIVVQGQVLGLPQWLPDGVRFNLLVEQATLNGQAVRLPDTLSLAWYRPRPEKSPSPASQDASHAASPAPDTATPEASHAAASPERPPGTAPSFPSSSPSTHRCTPCVQPGERWQMTVRLKQPHGSRNPFGFDYERWLWEQGLGATGYVRMGGQRPAPEKIGQAHPLNLRVWRDRARLHAREAVYQALLPQPPQQPQQAPSPPAAPSAAFASAPAAVTRSANSSSANLSSASIQAAAPAPQSRAAEERTTVREAEHAAERAAGIVAALLMGDQRA
ncbi:MAG: ComEC/Rec2 family competence protein, partial [Brachymonas sp.]|nr:ComEC/Rec2 family competence protein [Brachymonas sp.]